MPVFDAKNLDHAFEDQAVLAAILHPTQDARARALRQGLRRAEQAVARRDPMTAAPGHPLGADGLAPATHQAD